MSPVSYDFSGSSVLITGGTQGIGLAVAEAYARAGANVAICARTEGDVAEAVGALGELGSGAVCGVTADLAEPEDVGRLFDEVVRTSARRTSWSTTPRRRATFRFRKWTASAGAGWRR